MIRYIFYIEIKLFIGYFGPGILGTECYLPDLGDCKRTFLRSSKYLGNVQIEIHMDCASCKYVCSMWSLI